MKRKNVILAAVIAASTLTTGIPVSAADDTISISGNPTSATIPVEVSVASTYTVTVPKEITLVKDGDTDTFKTDYKVNVKGNISDTDHISVTVKNSTVPMTMLSKSVDATVTLDENTLEYTDVNSETGYDINGSATATGLTTGEWEGNVAFVVAVQ